MNNNLESYLSKLNTYHKNRILYNCKENNDFNEFILYSSKLNISLFDYDKFNTPRTHSYLMKKLKDYKELMIKSYGLKIVKEYKDNMVDILEFIKNHYKKLEIKINYINNLVNILETIIDSDNLNFLLGNNRNIEDKKVNYSCQKMSSNENIGIVEFSQDLFITSDELSASEENKPIIDSVNLVYNNNPFIAEYSN